MSKKEEPKPPSIFQMAKTFAGELTKYIKEGAPNVSNKVYIERLETCNTCPHLIKSSMRCGLCGCLLEHKAKWKTTTCPDKPERWKPVFMDKAALELKKNFDEQEEEEKRKQEILDKKRAIKAAKLVNEKRGFGNLKAKDLTSNNLKVTYKKINDAENPEDNNSKTSK
tara:strand:+ start:1569 stop:2072 length:504 start_codon:yes stop_codon:yes gene_type:complete